MSEANMNKIIEAVSKVSGVSEAIMLGQAKTNLYRSLHDAKNLCQFIAYVHEEKRYSEIAGFFKTSHDVVLRNVKYFGELLDKPAYRALYETAMNSLYPERKAA